MPLTDRAQAEDEPQSAFGRAGLIRVGNNAGIEQRRGFKGILVEKIGADQLALYQAESDMIRKSIFHLVGAGLELRQQVAVPSLKIFQDIRQLRGRVLDAKGQDTVNDMVGPGLVSGVQVAGFGGRLEGPHDNPGRIGTNIESLSVQELDL